MTTLFAEDVDQKRLRAAVEQLPEAWHVELVGQTDGTLTVAVVDTKDSWSEQLITNRFEIALKWLRGLAQGRENGGAERI